MKKKSIFIARFSHLFNLFTHFYEIYLRNFLVKFAYFLCDFRATRTMATANSHQQEGPLPAKELPWTFDPSDRKYRCFCGAIHVKVEYS